MANEKNLENIRHSLAHLLAAAVLKKFPTAKLGVGPVIENGFYYDFLLPEALKPEDLKEFQKEMKKMIGRKLAITGKEVSVDEAKELFKDQPFKLELIEDFSKESKQLTAYNTGDAFTDLCRGGHVDNTSEIDADGFQLTSIAGAYWRGYEKNQQLQRIYGLAFENKADLDAYLTMMEEAKKRDHRKLGKELKIFTFSDYVGPGLPLWLPNGTIIIEELEKLARDTERAAGYKQVRTPHIAKEAMYKTSGHLPYYADSMFPPMILEEESGATNYYLKAMNCPHHHQIYASELRSYRDLPLRLAEYGTVYRYEKSGELFGLMRVRMLNMNDGHIYTTPEQFASEFKAVNDMYLKYFKIFGITKYVMRFSTHDPKELGKKYIDDPKMWKQTEDMVRNVLQESGIEFVEVPNEAAFYGPKIDVQVWSSIGREFTLATNQVDFAVPARFGLTYIDTDGQEKTPLVIHRAPLGTNERFIGFLIEHYGGAFPFWLSPVQVMILPINDKNNDYLDKIKATLNEKNIRFEVDDRNESIGKKIRDSEIQKTPFVLVVGDKEVASNQVAVRERSVGDIGAMSLEDAIRKMLG